jgi:hypothetical protein
MRFTVKGLGGIQKWIYQRIPHVKVIAPKELRKEIGLTKNLLLLNFEGKIRL